MRALKALVIGMGILIIVGMGLVVYGMMRQADNLTSRQTFGEVSIPVPADCVLAEASPGERGLVVLRFQGSADAGCRQVLLFDSLRGELRGRIHLPTEQDTESLP